MKHLFILNPVAGKGKTLKLISEIRNYFKGKSDEHIIEITKYPGHATELASEYSAKDVYRIYAVGGDGTLNEVLNGMAGSSSSLGVIPSGSGNDFIKSIIDNYEIKNLLSQTIQGKERLIDYARVNRKYFLNITSIGFDAQVAHKTENFKKLPLISGETAYILGIFSAIMQCSNIVLEIKIDNVLIKTKTLLIAVGNGRYYGGGMLAVPAAEIDDGMFDICHVESMTRLKILRLFPKYIKGKHGNIKGVHFYTGKKVEIKARRPVPMNIDGEIEIVDKAVLEIIPKGLKLIEPFTLPQAACTGQYKASSMHP